MLLISSNYLKLLYISIENWKYYYVIDDTELAFFFYINLKFIFSADKVKNMRVLFGYILFEYADIKKRKIDVKATDF